MRIAERYFFRWVDESLVGNKVSLHQENRWAWDFRDGDVELGTGKGSMGAEYLVKALNLWSESLIREP